MRVVELPDEGHSGDRDGGVEYHHDGPGVWDEGCEAGCQDDKDELRRAEGHLHEEGADAAVAEAVDDETGELSLAYIRKIGGEVRL